MELEHPNQSLDDTLAVLADTRRRTVLHFLCEQADNVASIDELVKYLNSQERATGTEQTATPKQLEISLHHRHLPKLEEQGLITYDTRSGELQYTPDETTDALLQFVRDL